MRALWMAVALSACGEVNKIPDAAVPDAYEPDSAVAPNCAAGEMACNGVCADPMTSEEYCGNCDTQCPPSMACTSGRCLPIDNCAAVRGTNPMAGTGFYRNPNNENDFFYCDMENSTQYSKLALTLSSTVPTTHTMVRAADLTSPIGSKAFVSLYNAQAGIPTHAAFTLSNCCFKVAAGTFMMLDGGWMGSIPCQAAMNGTFQFGESATGAAPPIAENHFTLNIPTEGATNQCSDTINPVMIWQKVMF